MSLLGWINKQSSKRHENLFESSNDGKLFGLDLKQALSIHESWKRKVRAELSGKNQVPISVARLANGDNCELSQWLYSTGQEKYAQLPEYQTARKAHEDFHLTAATVVIEYQSGNIQTAQKLLRTAFRDASTAIQIGLVDLFAAVNRRSV